MFEDLIEIHQEVIASTPKKMKRYLYSRINWGSSNLCILGDRGVGKTTMMCQDLIERYQSPDLALYISADHVSVISYGLFSIAKEFFSEGGKALYIDEVHKYPEWSMEIKNIIDTYKGRQVIFSASSSVDLNESKGDLSRRVVYHRLLGLSFREYLILTQGVDLPVFSLNEILQNHVKIASELSPYFDYFKDYLHHGYYPYFLESVEDYFFKVSNVIEKVLFEDIAVIYNLKQTTMSILKKILWLVATSNGLIPNIDKMSKNLAISREMVYNCLEYLSQSGLLNEVYSFGKGNNLIRKPAKIYLNNSNLLHAIHGSLKTAADIGGIRETFFVNQIKSNHKVCLHDKGDFIIDDRWIFEVGGKNKDGEQIQGEKDAYLVLDNKKIGFGKKIPLYLFGFLY